MCGQCVYVFSVYVCMVSVYILVVSLYVCGIYIYIMTESRQGDVCMFNF